MTAVRSLGALSEGDATKLKCHVVLRWHGGLVWRWVLCRAGGAAPVATAMLAPLLADAAEREHAGGQVYVPAVSSQSANRQLAATIGIGSGSR